MLAVPRDREDARHREVRLCLDSWQTAQGSAINVALNVDNIGLANLQRTGYEPQPSPDRALTAFAQLAVLRLNVDRAMVSLIDTSTQTILAEANREDSHSSEDGVRPPTVLWLGTTTLARQDAVCPACLDGTYAAPSTSTGPDGAVLSQTTQAFIVPDCSLDPRFQNRPYVRDSPFIRFYAGVPIISRNGHKIGAYAVSDGRPRHGFSLQDVQFMQGMAQTIMEHLEWARDRVDRFKGERIVRGLAAFIESSSAPSDPANTNTQSRAGSAASLDRRPKTPQATLHSPRHPLSRQTSYFGARAAGLTAAAPKSQSRSLDPSRGLHDRLDSQAPPSPGAATAVSERAQSKGESRKRSSSDAMSTMLQQAADILCQSTLADGAVLLGASASSTRQMSWAAAQHTNGHFSSDEDDPVASSPDSAELPHVIMESVASPSTFRGDKLSRVLAYSIMDGQTRHMFEQGKGALTLGTLEKYYSLFPKGKTFSFTGLGASITSEDDSASDRDTPRGESAPPNADASSRNQRGSNKNERGLQQHQEQPGQPRSRRKPKTDHTELLQRIPGAKMVVFVPLFDHAENSFSGGCFLWTSVAGRLMNLDEDLSYLRAFANSIMSQVARISAQKNEAAKTTFIASMSHELRSPLHGILGAAEFLADTSADSFQAGLVSSISTCGKTLLDTLNHVLDYSKINRLGRSRRRRAVGAGSAESATGDISSDSLDSLNLTAVVDLSALVEEVIDAIVTGHTFKQTPSISTPDASGKSLTLNKLAPTPHVSLARDEPVSVLVDISPPGTWLVRTQPGALRRIVMNLFGNALKYTSAGYIMVTLTVKQTTESARTDVLIRVIDSGKGMSSEFQRDRLFVPFMQEDQFQPGTGLGLSIVKQIVDSLDGSIDVASEKGKGTEIDVRTSLPTAVEHGYADQELAWIRKHARGLRMVILDGDMEAQAGKAAARHASRLNHIIAKTCYSWFGLNVAHEEDGASLDADIFMYCEPPSLETLEKRFKQDEALSGRKWHVPVIIVCLDAQEVLRISHSQKEVLTKGYGRIVELIPQPCGPRKLAKVIELCLRKAEELANKVGPTDEMYLSRRLPLDSKKQRPSEKDIQRRGEMTEAEAKVDEVQTEPTSIPVRPMHDENRTTSMTVDGTVEDKETDSKEAEEPRESILSNGQQDAVGYDDKTRRKRNAATGATELSSLQKAIEHDKTPERPKNERLRVLVVDDNKINLQLLVMFMKKSGFTYEQAEDGKEALEKYQAAHKDSSKSTNSGDGSGKSKVKTRGGFDWVLMDISMPVMDGIEATRHIREFEREHNLEPANIVALTGLASEDAQRDAKTAGVDIFMAKPVRFAALKKQMLGTKQQVQPSPDQSS